jgi:hypothetical protein
MKLPTLSKPVMRKVSTAKIEAGISQSDCDEQCANKEGLAWKICKKLCEIKEDKVTT